MTVSEMIIKLESNGLSVSKVPEDTSTLHVDGYLSPNGRGLPDWIYSCPGWGGIVMRLRSSVFIQNEVNG